MPTTWFHTPILYSFPSIFSTRDSEVRLWRMFRDNVA